MKSQGAAGKPGIQKLTLENYLDLDDLDVIAPSILNKIIAMHGFNSRKVPRNDLKDAVRSINLMDAHRSTLQSDGASSHAFLSLKDVIKDLSALPWHECCVTSVQTINSVTDFSSGVDTASGEGLKSYCKAKVVSGLKDMDDNAEASSIVIDSGTVGGSTLVKVSEDAQGHEKQSKRSKLTSLLV